MAAQAGLCLVWSETPEDTFSHGSAHKHLRAKLDVTDLEANYNENVICVDMKLKVLTLTGCYSSPQHLLEEIHHAINARYAMPLTYSSANIAIDYGTNNARDKTDFQDPNRVKHMSAQRRL